MRLSVVAQRRNAALGMFQDLSEYQGHRVHAAVRPAVAADAPQRLDRLERVHVGAERVGEELGGGIEDGRAAMSRLAESNESFKGEAVGIDGHGDVDLATTRRHLHGDAGKGGWTGLFHDRFHLIAGLVNGSVLKVNYSAARETLN